LGKGLSSEEEGGILLAEGPQAAVGAQGHGHFCGARFRLSPGGPGQGVQPLGIGEVVTQVHPGVQEEETGGGVSIRQQDGDNRKCPSRLLLLHLAVQGKPHLPLLPAAQAMGPRKTATAFTLRSASSRA
jgi:hypothetical protein